MAVTLPLPSPLWAQGLLRCLKEMPIFTQRLMRKEGVTFTLSKCRSLNVIWKQSPHYPPLLPAIRARNEMARAQKTNTTASQEKEKPWHLMTMESPPLSANSVRASAPRPPAHLVMERILLNNCWCMRACNMGQSHDPSLLCL